jgi:uncharacterized protein (TIGR03437 family)
MPKTTKLTAGLFLISVAGWSRLERETCGTYPGRGAEEVHLHRHSRAAWAAKSRQALGAVRARDIGNIAVLDAGDGVISRRNPFSLDRKLLRFTPTAARYRYALEEGGYNDSVASAGTPLTGLDDDDTRELELPFAFPFYGVIHRRVFINSDGNLTFGESDTAISDRALGRMTAGPPRISPFFEDLDPSRPNGSVRVTASANRFTVSWVTVPEFVSSGTGPLNTFQVSLFPDGRVEFAWQGIGSTTAVVGLAPGELRGGTAVVSFAAESTEYAGAVAERFAGSDEVDIVFAAQKFFETHDDSYDFLAIYNTLGIPAAPGAVAFEVTVRNDREGIGDRIIDEGRQYGSSRRLQAMLNMGPLTQYPRDPNAVVPSRSISRDTPLTVLGHEVGHLWLAFVSVREPGNPEARPMLGRQTAHWAFAFNSEASLLEGNRIRDNGLDAAPRYTTVATVEGYAPLDQYLMGMRDASEVPATFYVQNPTIGTANRAPQAGVSFDGFRRDVTIQELAGVEGRRTPDHTVSQRRFRVAFLLITREGGDPTADELDQLEALRQGFGPFFQRATDGRAFADTSLRDSLSLSLGPAAGVLAGASMTASVSLARPPAGALTVRLASAHGVATVPASVTIPAGQLRAAFTVRGERVGVEELRAETDDDRYAPAYARVQVLEGHSGLRLVLTSGNNQAATSGQPLRQPLVFKVADLNQLPYAGLEVTAAVSSGDRVQPERAVSDQDGLVRFTWTPGPGPVHELRAQLAVAAQVSGTAVALGKPAVAAGGVVNAASQRPGLSPGGIFTIYGVNLAGGRRAVAAGPLPEALAGVRVQLDGQFAPLLFVSDRQINAVAPTGLAVGTTAVVVQSTQGGTTELTPAVSVPVRGTDPGIFVIDTATSEGAVLVAGSGQTTARQPARAGEIVEIYATGLGLWDPGGGIVPPETLIRARVLIGGREGEVLFSGPSPQFPGLYQVNARVPDGLAAGAQTMQLRSGEEVSNAARIFLR